MNIDRNARPQDITWFLDQSEGKRLDLTPPYQRRSVWNIGDRMFFMETILLNFPCPAVFLYKDINDKGKAIYQVIDGRQRLETILDFVNDGFKTSDSEKLPAEARGKLFSELDQQFKLIFWNYSIPVEMINSNDGSLLNDIFDRLNRNNRKLNRQELRNARFDGKLFTYISKESEDDFWSNLNLFTKSAISRMEDHQYITELSMVISEEKVLQFEQEAIDKFYSENDLEFDEELVISEKFKKIKKKIILIENENGIISRKFRTRALFYSIWAYLAVTPDNDLQSDIKHISKKLEEVASHIKESDKCTDEYIKTFLFNSKGASTDRKLREKRQEALQQILK